MKRHVLRRLLKVATEVAECTDSGRFSTIDHLHAVTKVVEKTMEYKLPHYMAFVDYEKGL